MAYGPTMQSQPMGLTKPCPKSESAKVIITNFALIFSYFLIFEHSCDNCGAIWGLFSNLYSILVSGFLPLKTLQTSFKSAYKYRRYLLLNFSDVHEVNDDRKFRMLCKETEAR